MQQTLRHAAAGGHDEQEQNIQNAQHGQDLVYIEERGSNAVQAGSCAASQSGTFML